MSDKRAVPEGWTVEPLSNCVDVLDSRRKPVNLTERASRSGPIPYFGATGQVGWIDDYLFDEELVLLGEDGAPFLDKSKPIAYIISGKSWVNNHAHVLRARGAITSNRYIKYYLDAFDFSQYVQGSTRYKLTQRAMNSIPVALAPRLFQDVLVALIEGLLERRASAATHLVAAKRAIERFRQSVLAAACSGRLTASWRLERGLQDVDIPAGWKESKLGEVADLIPGAGFPLADQGQTGKELPFFKVGNLAEVGDAEPLIISKHTVSRAEALKLGARVIPEGATVFAKIGMAIALNRRRLLGQPSCIDNNMMAAVPIKGVIEGRYLLRFLQTVDLMHLAHATTVPSLRKSDLESLLLLLPPLSEQQEISRRVEQLLGQADSLTGKIEVASRRVERTSQAVLAKAFRGELLVS